MRSQTEQEAVRQDTDPAQEPRQPAVLHTFPETGAREKKLVPVPVLVLLDFLLLAAALVLFALFHHVIPRAGQALGTQIQAELGDFREKFAGMFTSDGSVEQTGTSYRSGNVNITISEVQQGSNTYYIADVYVASTGNFRTAFAEGTYGKGFSEETPAIAQRVNAILAVNGDYYGNRDNGVVIRNGTLYRDSVYGDVCVLYANGEMATYSAEEFDCQAAIEAGAWQAWSFGPALLDENGQAKTFETTDISGVNPRTAIGYYEPGHYCFVVVDGRQAGYSMGMSFRSLSELFEELGCQAAYNLDGGRTSVMSYLGEVVNQPYKDGRGVSDILYITDN